MAIRFFTEDIIYIVRNKNDLRKWITKAVYNEGYRFKDINYIYCSDNGLQKINSQYLRHTTFTDIITFDFSEEKKIISGEIYISIDRVRENASDFNVYLRDELHRVMIHGILHLCGYRDKTEKEKKRMRNRENYYLSLRSFL